MIPVAAVLAAVLLVSKVGPARSQEVAEVIAAKAETVEDALLLIVTNDGESGFQKRVEDCRVLGDGGRAFGSYQLHRHHFARHSRAEVCADAALQTELAIVALSHGPTIRVRIAAFMGRKTNDREVSRRVQVYERLMKGVLDA